MITLMLLIGIYTTLSGPAFDDWRAKKKARRDFPGARIQFALPSAVTVRTSD